MLCHSKTVPTEEALHSLENVVFRRFLWKSKTLYIFCESTQKVAGNKNVSNLHSLGGSLPLAVVQKQKKKSDIFLSLVLIQRNSSSGGFGQASLIKYNFSLQ